MHTTSGGHVLPGRSAQVRVYDLESLWFHCNTRRHHEVHIYNSKSILMYLHLLLGLCTVSLPNTILSLNKRVERAVAIVWVNALSEYGHMFRQHVPFWVAHLLDVFGLGLEGDL